MFIVFEGIDGSGKTTLINLLRKEYPDACFTREPGGSAYGEKVRSLVLSEDNLDNISVALAMQSARVDHANTLIKPALEKGHVFCDRYYGSSLAYQDCKTNPAIFDIVLKTTPLWPNFVFFLDCSVDVAMARSVKVNAYDRKTSDYYQSVKEIYGSLALQMPDTWKTLDANLSPEELLETVKSYII